MRKNGVNKTLTPIEGGVCAPVGFRASGIRCGCGVNDAKEDLALVVADKRFPVAAVFSQNALVGAPTAISKKHMQSGFARAVVVNSGIANVFAEDGEEIARSICAKVGKKLGADADEILICSTGEIGLKFPTDKILQGVDFLVQSLDNTHENSLAAARALMTTDKRVKQLSYSFDLGDYPCKIGAIFKGGRRVCPNMATTLCVLTTDVDITSEMLQKALSAATNDTLNLLDLDGISSPNDAVYIFTSRAAGNYRISCADSEYKKFAAALERVLDEVCRVIAKEGERLFVWETVGAKSKRVARAIAKAAVGANALKARLEQKEMDITSLLCVIGGVEEKLGLENTEIILSSQKGKLTLFMDGKALTVSSVAIREILSADEITIKIDLGEGNYGARAIGCV
ncbi:MAG: bifunctional ornithine acetyltransferase/N-acetylglutamate synthase [Clostridia bacterium]|nr:bifunctional ornithine acetyltransferase/N-acetylglutamate synthase [Clostridia bacterium]